MSDDIKKSDFGDMLSELTEVQGHVLEGLQSVIPRILQAVVIQAAHKGHQGQDHIVKYL